MNYKGFKRLLNQIVVVGKTKKTFFRKSKDFELQLYYTPLKSKIMIININGVELDNPRLGFNFEIGDKIDVVFDWIEQNGHKVTFERNRLQN